MGSGCDDPNLLPPAGRSQPDVPGEAGLPGQQRQGLSAAVHRSHLPRSRSTARWKAVWLENEFLRRHGPARDRRAHPRRCMDKTNGYDFIYHQNVIKPALVGLAGPWISGGIEFNWPQHHRPATFCRCDFEIEEHADGIDDRLVQRPRPDGPHEGHARRLPASGQGVPRTEGPRSTTARRCVQTFLWWANVATRVHEHYQSFFPPDVQYVADHAKRAMSEYPAVRRAGTTAWTTANARRHGVPAQRAPAQFDRRPATDPVERPVAGTPTSPCPPRYMCMGTKQDFFGGYDHAAQAGIVHVANHHISPGKKQWTWGNHEFGYAWDRNLTDGRDGESALHRAHGRRLHRQPARLLVPPARRNQDVEPVLVSDPEDRPGQHANLEAAVSLHVAMSAGEPPALAWR